MTATSLNLGGQPQIFEGAYITDLNSSLGLSQSPSTCNVTLVEDINVTPSAVFTEPTPGSFRIVRCGSFEFGGIITAWNRDIANIAGRQIQVSLSDPREIMGSLPMILAPGYRDVAAHFAGTDCSVLDVFGAFDDFDETGLNLSSWNQAGMPYQSIYLALRGGDLTAFGTTFSVVPLVPSVYGQLYRFHLDEVTARVDPGYRINSNLLSLADMIQELASRHSFDWYVESEVDGAYVDVTVRIVDRRVDNLNIDLDNFLVANSGFVVSANRGYELRNDVSCVALLGAPIEQLRALNIQGMANNPVDLSEEGFVSDYLMEEIEQRYVLTSKEEWRVWVAMNGGLDRYTVGGASQSLKIAQLWDVNDNSTSDLDTQLGVAPDRQVVDETTEETVGKIFDKLNAAATASYGKRFLFQRPTDVEIIDAAWTVDVVAGAVVGSPLVVGAASTSNPSEYFRNEDGKTRCYVEFKPTSVTVVDDTEGSILGFGGSFTFGKGDSAPQTLLLDLRNEFDIEKFNVELDKSDWVQHNGLLYVAATVEEDNVVRIDSPVIYSEPDIDENAELLRDSGPQGQQNTAQRTQRDKPKRNQLRRALLKGAIQPALHPEAYQPNRAFVPTKNKFLRYGPVFSSTSIDGGGKVEIDQDDGFAPWEFGSFAVMLDAMQIRVDNAASNVRTVETAILEIEGLPRMTIGEALGFNSNINNLNVTFGIGGVRTTYTLRSFLRVFGELSRDELIALSLFARRGGARIFPSDMVSFINKYRPIISKQFGGVGYRSTSGPNGGALNFE